MSQFVTGSSLTSARAAAAWVEAILVGELGRRREVTVRETVLRLLTCPELGKESARLAKWDPRRVGFYRARFQEETACLSRG